MEPTVNYMAFQQLTSQIALAGATLIQSFIKAGARDKIIIIRDMQKDYYEQTIKLIEQGTDFIQWREFFIQLNLSSPLFDMDKTGELLIATRQLMAFDLAEHYYTAVVPLLDQGVDHLQSECDLVMMAYDGILDQMAADRRSKMHAVG